MPRLPAGAVFSYQTVWFPPCRAASDRRVRRPVARFRQRGVQMRYLMASVLVACTGIASPAHAQWMEAKIPGEQHRTVQGCAAEARKPGDWVCIFVRCDQPGSPPSLHFSTPGPDIQGNIKLVIDDATFTLSVTAKSPLALST